MVTVAGGISRFPVCLRGFIRRLSHANICGKQRQDECTQKSAPNAVMVFWILKIDGNYIMRDSIRANRSFYIGIWSRNIFTLLSWWGAAAIDVPVVLLVKYGSIRTRF